MRKVIIIILGLALLGILAWYIAPKDIIEQYTRGFSQEDKASQTIPGLSQKVKEEIPPDPQQNTDKLLIEETAAYSRCLDRTYQRTVSSLDRYLSWVDGETGPNCKERYITYSLYPLYKDGIQRCQKAVQRGVQGKPDLPVLEAQIQILSDTFAQLVPLVQTASDYYKQQDYKDDDCKKGKELHPQLMNLFTQFKATALIMKQEMKKAQEGLAERHLKRIEANYGKNLNWHSTHFLLSSEEIMDTIPDGQKEIIPKDKFLEDFKQLEKDYFALEAYSQENIKEVEESHGFTSAQSRAKEFYAKAKFLKRKVAEDDKKNAREVKRLIQDYDYLVRSFQSTVFPNKQKISL